MPKFSLLNRIFRSRKCRYLLFSVWLTFILILFFSHSLFDVENYIPKTSSYSTLSPSTVWNFLKKAENVTINDPEKILQIIQVHNEEQFVRNLDSFGLITNETIIIVIQTHARKTYLQALIESLKNSRYISDTLLIFSHGSYNKEINEVVEDIKFTRVLQIFFPYSLQTHLNSFPGFSPGDCPHGVPKSELPNNCFGKQRDVKSLQVKHHWWWKINFVFNHLRITQDFEGLVLFLEEDHYVFPDVLHMLKLMKTESITKCSDCNVFGVGKNPERRSVIHYRSLSEKVSVQQWNNMGFAFTRQFWQGLNQPKCKNMFCEYNDYNWDFTLAYLSHKCLPQEIKPLTVISPRVFHIGDCGMHFHGACDETKSLDEARDLQRLVAEFLFPPQLMILYTDFQQGKVDGRNGGWDDPRDIQLCKNISQNQQ